MHYFFDDIISIKNLGPNNIKIDKESYENILNYYAGYVVSDTFKPLYFFSKKANGYI